MSQRTFKNASNPVFECAASVLLLPFGRRSFLPAIVDVYSGEEVPLDETTDREVFQLLGAPSDVTLVFSGLGSPAAGGRAYQIRVGGSGLGKMAPATVTPSSLASITL